MPTWLIVLLSIQVIGFLIFMVQVLREAPKHGAQVTGAHVVVGLLWPVWGVWYVGSLIAEKWRNR